MTNEQINIDKLFKICQETTNMHIKISVVKHGEWSLYIYKSKIIFYGSFNEVLEAAIKEFTTYRIDPVIDAPKNYVSSFRYTKKPDGRIVLPKKMPYQKLIVIPKIKSNIKDSYTQKLNFSISLGFKNFSDCYASLGSIEFNNQFKKYINER